MTRIDQTHPEQNRFLCHECGMPLRHPAQFHPYAACVLFKTYRASALVQADITMIAGKKDLQHAAE